MKSLERLVKDVESIVKEDKMYSLQITYDIDTGYIVGIYNRKVRDPFCKGCGTGEDIRTAMNNAVNYYKGVKK